MTLSRVMLMLTSSPPRERSLLESARSGDQGALRNEVGDELDTCVSTLSAWMIVGRAAPRHPS
jgi:hypothetical protein